MRVRPLNLVAHLRSPVARWDWLFYLDAGLLVLFFTLFAGGFVLAPSLSLKPPSVSPGAVGYNRSTTVVSIKASGQIFTPETGRVSYEQLRKWLRLRADQTQDPALLIVADATVSYADLTRIYEAAAESGFRTVSLAAEPASEK